MPKSYTLGSVKKKMADKPMRGTTLKMSGQNDQAAIQRLSREMNQATKSRNYAQASRLRKKVEALKKKNN